MAEHFKPTTVGNVQSDDTSNERRLAGSVWAEESDERPLWNDEVDAGQSFGLAPEGLSYPLAEKRRDGVGAHLKRLPITRRPTNETDDPVDPTPADCHLVAVSKLMLQAAFYVTLLRFENQKNLLRATSGPLRRGQLGLRGEAATLASIASHAPPRLRSAGGFEISGSPRSSPEKLRAAASAPGGAAIWT